MGVITMNNKGMTIVELIVTFSLLLVIVVGMFNLITDVKLELENKQIGKDFTEYSSTIGSKIQYDFLNSKVGSIAFKNNSGNEWSCVNSSGPCVDGTNGEYEFGNESITFGALNSMCKDITPCIVYSYKDGSANKTRVIGLNIKPNESGALAKYGIYYNDVFEAIPDQDYVEIKNVINVSESDAEEDVVAKLPEARYDNGLFVIDFPFYLVDNNKNYGFKIVYSFDTKGNK